METVDLTDSLKIQGSSIIRKHFESTYFCVKWCQYLKLNTVLKNTVLFGGSCDVPLITPWFTFIQYLWFGPAHHKCWKQPTSHTNKLRFGRASLYELCQGEALYSGHIDFCHSSCPRTIRACRDRHHAFYFLWQIAFECQAHEESTHFLLCTPSSKAWARVYYLKGTSVEQVLYCYFWCLQGNITCHCLM